MYRYSATQWIFGNESLEKSFERLRRYGYDGVELAGEPDQDVGYIQRLLSEYGLICTSICGIYHRERDLSSPDPAIRGNAVDYVKACVDMAAALGAAHVIVVPSPVGKTAPDTTADDEWRHAVNSVREAGEYALSRKINLAVEALNRYETYLVNDLGRALHFVDEVNVASVKIMADLFHMNIEERSHAAALKAVALHLIHVHIADNTREAAGLGQTDFTEIMAVLREIGYRGPITMEFLPPVSNPYEAAHLSERSSIYDMYTEQSIRHIKGIVDQIERSV